MKAKGNKFINIVFGILIVLSPYIHSNGSITGDNFPSPMYETFYISKIICTIVGIYMINKEI